MVLRRRKVIPRASHRSPQRLLQVAGRPTPRKVEVQMRRRMFLGRMSSLLPWEIKRNTLCRSRGSRKPPRGRRKSSPRIHRRLVRTRRLVPQALRPLPPNLTKSVETHLAPPLGSRNLLLNLETSGRPKGPKPRLRSHQPELIGVSREATRYLDEALILHLALQPTLRIRTTRRRPFHTLQAHHMGK